MSIVVGVDIGGTFTDLVLHDEAGGAVRVAKVPSTPADPSRALLDGLRALRAQPAQIGLIVHGTTVATNAVLERTGAAVGVITTEGFRDVIELRRRDRPDTYGLKGRFEPLAPRYLRLEVPERTDYRGAVHVEPPADALRTAAATLRERGAEAVVVSFLNAYANPANERRAREVVARAWPNAYVVAATDVLPEIREFERTSTAVLNGYVQPLIGDYLNNLMQALAAAGYRHDVLLIQSNGGVASQAVARRLPVNTILSGPAAGVAAAGRLGAAVGARDLITCDVGGTSLDIAVVVDGRPATARDAALEYGLPIRVPMLDIRAVGAGGGSIAWIDRAGVLGIGPHSAGADPGPACYGQGGTEPTVTDANVLLGRINAANPIGGATGFRLDAAAAERALQARVGDPLGLAPAEAAWAVLQVANHKMAASIRMLTVEQGLDPRDFTLVAYGGAGPLHAAALLRELELARALIPPWPGITSALGCLTAEVRRDFVQSVNQPLDALEPAHLYDIMAGHVAQGRADIEGAGVALERIEPHYQADMAYDGQIHEVRTPLPEAATDRDALRAAFETAYRTQYGQALSGRAVRVVTLRTAVVGVRPTLHPRPAAAPPGAGLAAARKEVRPVYFAEGFRDTPVYERERLPADAAFDGPAVVEQGDATTVVEPGMRCHADAMGNLVLEALHP